MPTNLRIRLESGPCGLPLRRVHSVAGFASLSGEPDEYFRGWLRFHGRWAPVFDLNRVVCETPTAEYYGSRIILVDAAADAPVTHIGLLAPGVTDTVAANEAGVPQLDLDLYLQMVVNFIPPAPAQPS